jgi:8-oxo-dGTP pyrophosphatase MutT (NUDIX family)
MTASAFVFAPDFSSVLLVHHHRLRRWLQPGGHVEVEDASLPAAAAREVWEETGIPVKPEPPPAVAGISVHKIPASGKEPEHWHHDVLFSMVAASRDFKTSGEAPQVAWCPLNKLADYGLDSDLIEMITRSAAARQP